MALDIGDLETEDLLNDVFSAYNNVNGPTVGVTVQTVTLDTEHFTSSANYSLSSSEVTITAAGTYEIAWSVATENSIGGRTLYELWLEEDTVEIAGTRSVFYNRNTNYGDTVSGRIFYDVGASGVIRIRMNRVLGSSNAIPEADMARLTLRRMW